MKRSLNKDLCPGEQLIYQSDDLARGTLCHFQT